MKLSWKASKSYTGFVKFIGKMAGTVTETSRSAFIPSINSMM